jgi:hypothetical protein
LEEKEAKDLLNLKITADQELDDLSIKAKAEEKLRAENRENQIKLQLRVSVEEARDKRLDEEVKDIIKINADLDKENVILDKFIVDQGKKIEELVAKISISALLKEVDLEEVTQLGQTQENLNNAFVQVLTKWKFITDNLNKQ